MKRAAEGKKDEGGKDKDSSDSKGNIRINLNFI